MPNELVELLASSGHDVHTVASEMLTGHPDTVIFQTAFREDRLLITQDLDFSDIRRYKPGTHPGIVLVRLRDPSRRRLLERVKSLLQSENLQTWAGCFVVIGDKKLRVRRA